MMLLEFGKKNILDVWDISYYIPTFVVLIEYVVYIYMDCPWCLSLHEWSFLLLFLKYHFIYFDTMIQISPAEIRTMEIVVWYIATEKAMTNYCSYTA
jgi:hypothetical protein